MNAHRHLLACLVGAALSVGLVACSKPKGDTATSGTESDTGDSGDSNDTSEPAATIEEACAGLFGCTCAVYPYEDQAACVNAEELYLADIELAAASEGLTVDHACFIALRPFNVHGCEAPPWIGVALGEEGLGHCPGCQLAYGTKGIGDPCTNFEPGGLSDCAQGLLCAGNIFISAETTCYDPCAAPTVDAPCPAAGCGDTMICGRASACVPKIGREGDECAYGEVVCGPGLACDENGDEDSVCIAGVAPGEACDGCAFCCAGDYYCGASSTCEALPGPGEPCTPSLECTTGTYCTTGNTCAVIPDVGEACEDRCVDWMPCAEATKVCTPFPGYGEPCVDGVCDEWLECGPGEICTAAPAVCSM